MHLHREGRKIILLSALVLIILCLVILSAPIHVLVKCLLLLPFTILFLLILWFFRVPARKNEFIGNLVYAPADGKIVVIEETQEDEFFHDRRIQISIFMSPLNVHQNSYPVSGNVIYKKYHKGKYLVAWHPKSSIRNERTTLVIKLESGPEILIRQIAGAVARRICNYSQLGEKVKQGEELGFIRFGSRVDVLLPLSAKIRCRLHQISYSKLTVLAEL